MTGWSGDGAPGTGSLREFAIGAVTQHFTKRLARVAGRDFKLPKEHQLDAMEAFQLSLGRSADFDLSKITFLDRRRPDRKILFINGTGDPNAGGTCGFCHTNGGALSLNVRTATSTPMSKTCSHPARSIQDISNRRRLRADPTTRTAPSATAPSTPRQSSKRQTRRRSFITTS